MSIDRFKAVNGASKFEAINNASEPFQKAADILRSFLEDADTHDSFDTRFFQALDAAPDGASFDDIAASAWNSASAVEREEMLPQILTSAGLRLHAEREEEYWASQPYRLVNEVIREDAVNGSGSGYGDDRSAEAQEWLNDPSEVEAFAENLMEQLSYQDLDTAFRQALIIAIPVILKDRP